MRDERFFEMASEELSSGQVRPGLRAKAFSDANGVEAHAQALYLKYRAAQLAQEEKLARREGQDAYKTRKKQQSSTDNTASSLGPDEPLTGAHYAALGVVALIIGAILWASTWH